MTLGLKIRIGFLFVWGVIQMANLGEINVNSSSEIDYQSGYLLFIHRNLIQTGKKRKSESRMQI